MSTYPAEWLDEHGDVARLSGEIRFTDPNNQPGGGASAAGLPTAWVPYAGNPVVPSLVPGAVANTTWADVVYDAATGLFHLFASVDAPGAAYGIYELLSTDGLSFDVGHAAQVLGPGAQTWNNQGVDIPCCWKEGDTWYLLFSAFGSGSAIRQIGLATRTGASGAFTLVGTTPVITQGGGGAWDNGLNLETGPGRIIKVGATYVLFYSTISTSTVPVPNSVVRSIGVATSTDRVTWTKDAANPIFVGGRFCNSVFTRNGLYYSLVPKYRGYDVSVDFELWQSRTPQFYTHDRVLLGVFYRAKFLTGLTADWDYASVDTPTLASDDVTRSSCDCTGGVPRVYFGGKSNGGTWLEGVLEPANDLLPAPAAFTPAGLNTQQVVQLGPWCAAAVAQNLSEQVVFLPGGGSTFKEIPILWPCSLVALSATFDTNLTSGNLQAFITKNGAHLASCVVSSGVANGGETLDPYQFPLIPGDLLGVKFTSSAGMLPTGTANLTVCAGLLYDRA